MKSPARVGIVGCGVISDHYVENSAAFDSFEITACADLDSAVARKLAAKHGLEAATVDELVDDPAIDLVLNLTPPAAHAAVTLSALAAGKHVYSEKPLATTTADAAGLLAEADRLGLRIGCAPDTFLGGPYQSALALLEEGAIGAPLSVNATMLVGGADGWHPNPELFFADGAGPMLDMGPYYLTAIVALVGPVRRVAGFASTRATERTIATGPRAGVRFPVTTPTHVSAALELQGGVTASLVTSFEASDRYVCDIEIHGTEGTLALPDPNAFEGPLRIRIGSGDWQDAPFGSRGAADARGLGLHDLVEAIAEDRPHRASGQLALHVVDVARSVLRAADERRVIEIESPVEQPQPLPVTPGSAVPRA